MPAIFYACVPHLASPVTISKLGCTNLVFIKPGAKINGQYYRDMVLMQELLPVIRSIAGDVFVFQQRNVPTHRARQTVRLLCRETPDFISPDMWPANSTVLNPVDYHIWSMMQEQVYKTPIRDVVELWQQLVQTWHEFQQIMVDDDFDQWGQDSKHVFRQTTVISNSTCDVVYGTIFPHHSTTSSFQSNPLFPEENNINFD